MRVSLTHPLVWRCAAIAAIPVVAAGVALAVPDPVAGRAYDLDYRVVADGEGGVCITQAPDDWPESLDHLLC